MMPIVATVVLGRHDAAHPLSHLRGFSLALAYVLGMALTYALAGVFAGLSGTLVSGLLQNPWVLGSFALIYVVLAGAMLAMSPGLVVLTLSLLLGLQPIATDLYLPALPALTDGFGAAMSQAQLTLTALLLAFGVSQMFWGPLSDRFGRRPILLIGMSAFVVASVGSTFSPSIEQLIVWRAVQGAAMGAGVMCARAIVRDLYTPAEGARAMSKGLSGLGVIAFLSPPLGGLLSDAFGWRMALLALALFGAVALVLIVWRFEETVPARNPNALQPGNLLRTWAHILRSPTFWAYALLTAASYGGLFTFLAASSFVFIDVLGLTRTQFGWTMASACVAYLAGTFLCRRLLVRQGLLRTVASAGALSVSGGTLMAAVAFMGWHQPWALLLPFYLFMLGHGIHQPCGQSGAVGPFPKAAGVASALNGFMMMLAAFGIGGWLGMRLGPFLLAFYARRLMRIMPALVACLLVTFVLSALFIPPGWLSDGNERTGRYAFWGLANWALARGGNDYFSPRTEFNPFTHTWSLGVEEQYYLVSTAAEKPAKWRRKSLPVLVGFPCSVGGRFLVPA